MVKLILEGVQLIMWSGATYPHYSWRVVQLIPTIPNEWSNLSLLNLESDATNIHTKKEWCNLFPLFMRSGATYPHKYWGGV